MSARNYPLNCSFVLIAEGFDEMEAITILSTLRRASLCVKLVGLTGGLISGASGVWVKPDITFTELCDLVTTTSVGMLILPENENSLSKLETDPRFHQVIGQVFDQGGLVAAGMLGIKLAKGLALNGRKTPENRPDEQSRLVAWEPGQTVEEFAATLVRRLEQSHHL